MAEELHRNAGETAAYGYRQLPGSGSAGGIDMKTLAYGVIGVAMGIVVGTLAADGTLRSMIHGPALHSVQASIQTPKAPVLSTVNLAQAQTTKVAQAPTTPPAAKPPLAETTPANFLAAAQGAPKPFAALKSTTPVTTVDTPVLKVSATGKARPGHKLVSRRRHLGRRRIHSKHRAHFHLKSKAIAKLSADAKMPRPVETSDLFTFTVEGDVTVASYDVSLRQIDTYEGETFALNQLASLSDMIPFDAYPASLHYRCDQSWNCTLFRDGSTILSAKRMK
jgi:hypothetical protein